VENRRGFRQKHRPARCRVRFAGYDAIKTIVQSGALQSVRSLESRH
jgi:hypothetical protein